MKTSLTKRELTVMRILWDAKEPLIASEIAKRDNNASIFSIQRLLKNLIEKNMVEVSGIAYNKKAVARTFKPLVSAEDIEIDVIQDIINNLVSRNIAASHLIASLLPEDNDQKTLEELSNLEKLIQERKAQILNNNPNCKLKNK